MSKSTKTGLIIFVTVLLVFSTILTAWYVWPSSQDKSNKSEDNLSFSPLDTKSQKVYATYDGGVVTEGEVNLFININALANPTLAFHLKQDTSRLKPEFAKRLAAQKFLASRVKSPSNLKEETDKQFSQLKQALEQGKEKGKPAPKMEGKIKGYGITSDDLRKALEQDILVRHALKDRIKDMKFDYVGLNHVLVGTRIEQPAGKDGKIPPPKNRTDKEAKERALEVKRKLKVSKGDFKKIAKEFSDDTGSKENEGKYEGDASQYVKEFKEAALSLPIGKISDPVKTSFGYHVIRVNERKKMKVSQASEQIQQNYMIKIMQDVVEKEIKFKLKETQTKQPSSSNSKK